MLYQEVIHPIPNLNIALLWRSSQLSLPVSTTFSISTDFKCGNTKHHVKTVRLGCTSIHGLNDVITTALLLVVPFVRVIFLRGVI